ncbi:hypothetical protein OUZ56_018451 [Daphnia magna]|uniref:Uncharacterized protein n=1 Tax=Daphnia magna TaxID=35525 RepID=A0ABQ9Z8V8_9CRUS|nr:hypothetical protein OUZ56_018451 [Daphnia magna]
MILLFGFQVCTLHRLSSLKSYMLTRQCIWLDGLDALGSGFQGMYLWQELHYSSLFSWLQGMRSSMACFLTLSASMSHLSLMDVIPVSIWINGIDVDLKQPRIVRNI